MEETGILKDNAKFISLVHAFGEKMEEAGFLRITLSSFVLVHRKTAKDNSQIVYSHSLFTAYSDSCFRYEKRGGWLLKGRPSCSARMSWFIWNMCFGFLYEAGREKDTR